MLYAPQADRERLAQLAFEVFNVAGLYFADQAALALYSIGKSTGIVVDIGHEKTGSTGLWSIRVHHPSVRVALNLGCLQMHTRQVLQNLGQAFLSCCLGFD